jgi:hypothetical protein
MERECIMHWRDKKCIKILVRKGKRPLEDADVDKRKILKFILKKKGP